MLKYQLYIGLFDRETKAQEINTLDAYKVVGHVINRPCTITQGQGVYDHDDGTRVYEPSLIVEIVDFDKSVTRGWLIDKIETIKKALNQESVVLNVQNIKSELL